MTRIMTTHPVFSSGKAGAATPLLRFLAGTQADTIARIWPKPHTGFFALPAPRRHAAALFATGLAGTMPCGDAELGHWVTHLRDADLARHLMGRHTPGLMKMLGRIGEVLWSRADYARLLVLFAEPMAGRVLRHMPQVTQAAMLPIATLPAALREPGIVNAMRCLHAAEDLSRAFELAVHIRGAAKAPVIASRWTRARDCETLFAMAQEDLAPDVFRSPAPVPALPVPFERIATRKALEATAIAFRNCLRDFMSDIANGRMAIFVWHGTPAAAIALNWDAAGWRLAEAEAAGNEKLEEAPLREIAMAVTLAGGRTGGAVKAVHDRLDIYRHGRHCYDPVGPGFVDRLELGDLWN